MVRPCGIMVGSWWGGHDGGGGHLNSNVHVHTMLSD